MAYEKTEWTARQGVNLNRFEKSRESAGSVILENAPGAVSTKGTPFSAANMNKIENGIYEAHEGLAAEAQARASADQGLQQAADAEASARAAADNALGERIDGKADRAQGAKADSAYQKPPDGIPKSDLVGAVQTSLGKADSALQSVPDATASQKGVATLGAGGGAARHGQKSDVGLANVTDDAQVRRSEMGAAGGVATLGPDGKITPSQVPAGSGTPSSTTPKMDGTAAVGTEASFARGDHIHPTDTTRAPLASPVFTGTPKVPSKATAATSDGTLVATEAQVALKANLASPALTGTPTAPTAAAKNNSTQIATTAYADRAGRPVGSYYTQYPVTGQSTIANMFPSNESPATLFGGTWTEMYASEDVFFRTGALGGERGRQWNGATKAYETGTAGIEPDAIRNFRADIWTTDDHVYGNASGAFRYNTTGATTRAFTVGNALGPVQYELDPSLAVPTDATNHPINRLVKVWKRTA